MIYFISFLTGVFGTIGLVEIFLVCISGFKIEPFYFTKELIHNINLKTFRSKRICKFISRYDWEYGEVGVKIKIIGDQKMFMKFPDRVCKITGRWEIKFNNYKGYVLYRP